MHVSVLLMTHSHDQEILVRVKGTIGKNKKGGGGGGRGENGIRPEKGFPSPCAHPCRHRGNPHRLRVQRNDVHEHLVCLIQTGTVGEFARDPQRPHALHGGRLPCNATAHAKSRRGAEMSAVRVQPPCVGVTHANENSADQCLPHGKVAWTVVVARSHPNYLARTCARGVP